MAKLRVQNSREICRHVSDRYIHVLRERRYKTKPREIELLARLRGDMTSGYWIQGTLKPSMLEKTQEELEAWLQKYGERRNLRAQEREEERLS